MEEREAKPLIIAKAEVYAERLDNGDLKVRPLIMEARNVGAFIAWLREAYPEAF